MIRNENPQDFEAISTLLLAAFQDHPFSQQTEHLIVNALREAGALTISCVAQEEGKVVGHIAFSPVLINSGLCDWYGLGPVAVLPEHQGRGIGKALIQHGLAQLKQLGAAGCVLVGDPGYYVRFSFKSYPQLQTPDIPQMYFQALSLAETAIPEGVVTFHPAFFVDAH